MLTSMATHHRKVASPMLSEADRNPFRAHESHSSGARVNSGALSQSFRLELPINTTLKAWVSFL